MGARELRRLAQRHLLTVHEYERMGETGILAPDARVELIDGKIFDVAPMDSRHAGTVALLFRRFAAACGERAVVWPQLPLRLGQILRIYRGPGAHGWGEVLVLVAPTVLRPAALPDITIDLTGILA